MKHKKYMAVCYNVQTSEISQNYFHNDYSTLENWVRREGFKDSPDFDYVITPNPSFELETAE